MSKISYLFALSFVVLISCKQSTGPVNTGGGTTPQSVGDTIPGKNSSYDFEKSQLTLGDEIIPGYPLTGYHANVFATGLTMFGKSNVYFVIDEDNDTAYYTYEVNGDVSIYFKNPGYYSIYGNPSAPINEPLREINKTAFARWITFPISSTKATNDVVYDGKDVPFSIQGVGTRNADIHVTAEYLVDSTITIAKKTYTAKYCRITETASIKTKASGIVISTLTHSRTLWFVPKIGYIAKAHVRTDMSEYVIDLIPRDTTATLKVLDSYQLF